MAAGTSVKRKIKKIWEGINVVLIIAVAFLAIALAGVRLVGLDVYAVLSGSMEPEYQTGGVIYVKDVEDTSVLEIGDVITYYINEDTKVTHRIVDIVQENGQMMYQTKGDANDVVDAGLVAPEQIIGKAVFTIPYLGYLVMFIQSSSGIFIMISVAALLILMMILPDFILGNDEDKKEQKVKRKRNK